MFPLFVRDFKTYRLNALIRVISTWIDIPPAMLEHRPILQLGATTLYMANALVYRTTDKAEDCTLRNSSAAHRVNNEDVDEDGRHLSTPRLRQRGAFFISDVFYDQGFY